MGFCCRISILNSTQKVRALLAARYKRLNLYRVGGFGLELRLFLALSQYENRTRVLPRIGVKLLESKIISAEYSIMSRLSIKFEVSLLGLLVTSR